MSIASAHLGHVFGLREGVRGTVTFQDEQTILYPCGSTLVLYNIDQHAQKFIVGNEKAVGMTALAVSPNRRYVAVAEKGDKATITIYDLHSLRKKKTLSSNDVQSGEFVSIAFSPDSKYLAAQGADPDWTLVYWSWEKSKQLATLKPTSATNPSPIHQVSFNPQDSTQIAVAGQEYFKIFRYTENNLKPSGLVKIEPQNFLCHTWISDEKILVGTDTGKCILLDNGEQKMEFNTISDRRRLLAAQNESGETNIERPDHGVGNSITSIISASKGFAVACAPGTVLWYEKTDEKELFKAARMIRIPSDPNSADPTKAENQVIQHMCLSPSEDMIVAATDSFQLYSIALASAELSKSGDVACFEYVSQQFHSGQVLGLDLCIRKPIVATCGVDRSIRIWNYETNVLELYKEFAEEAYSIALHPSGLYGVVGFSDKLRLMNILIDDIRTFKEFPIRGCRECCFSNGGHFFAAVYGNVIQIYSTTTFENVNNLKGHNGKIRSICWTQDDSKLISCGMDGAVYEWEPTTGKRLSENVLKSCSYSDVAISPDGKYIYAVGSDKTLKEISDSQIKREMEIADCSLATVALSRSGKMLFCGTLSGTVRAIKFPLTQPGEWQEHFAHSGPIVKMKMSYHDDIMVTISEDGSVMLWRVSDKEGRGMKRDKETGWAEEILITKSDLEEKNANMTELKTRVEELKMENEYQLRLKDMNYNEKIKELTEKFIQEMESLKTKNQVLKTEKDKEEAKHEEELQEVMEKHGKELQDLESANNQKLMLEYEKYQELQTKSQKMQEDYERQIQDMEEKRVQALRDVTEEYETKLAELQETINNLTSEMSEERKGHEQSKCLIEEDADREILDTKIKYERQLREEKEKNIKLKGETGIMRKKFNSQQKEIEDFKVEIAALKDQTKAKENVIKNLEKDIAGLKKEIQERDETIQDKEKRIYDLKKKNQELEKFKFVLDYKIRELKKQIEPRENDIKSYKEQIQEMESELERFHKQNTQLELSISELKKKMKSCENELKKERQSTRDVEAVVRRFKTDLHNCVGYIQEPKLLKESIVALYKKHVQDDVTSEASVDADIQKEFARQREHLERSVASLKKKLVKDTEIHRADYVRIMQENVSLIKEINDLRRELKTSRTSIHDLEAALGLHRKNNESAKELLAMVTANKSNPMMEEDMDELKRVLDTQKTLIGQLRGRIRELESRPLSASGRHLPAIEAPL